MGGICSRGGDSALPPPGGGVQGSNPSKPDYVRAVDSFWDEIPPDGVSYIYSAESRTIPALVVGAITQILPAFVVPQNQVVMVTHVEYYVTAPIGAGGWADMPNDFVRNSLLFQVRKDQKPLWLTNHSFTAGGLNGQEGCDVLNRNVLGMFGAIPAKLFFGEGTTMTVQFLCVNAGLIVPLGAEAGVRIAGIQFDKALLKRVRV